ncbi:MAG TPA: zinc-binding dehydrogenase [Pseudomonadales bacterium]|nr:zinc-binding dehydrogenase [Pseudomonadales bacterium]
MLVGLVTGERRLELREMPQPVPTPGKAVVEIAYCGICGTDLHAFQSGEPYNPAICGHEWTGRVSAVGAQTSHVREGDRVAIGAAVACGSCATCRRGDAAHCETAFAGMIGIGPLAAPHGGFASAIAIDASRLYHVDPKLDDVDAAILEPATVAVHAVRRTGIRLGDSVLVLGAGPIGLLVLQAARAAGAGTVMLVEPQRSRRELGGSLGADKLIDPGAADVTEAVNAHIGAQGADIVIECAGIPRTIGQAVSLVRRGGTVSLVGVPNGPAQIQAAEWLVKEVRVATSLAYLREEFDIAQGLVADGRMRCAALHTSTVSLQRIGDAFERLSAPQATGGPPQDIKVLVDPRL